MNSMYRWNEVVANAVELFGLPGDRYITDVNENSMTWSFDDHRDAMLFQLKFSGVTQ